MTNRELKNTLGSFACVAFAASMVTLAGCSEEEAPVVQAPPPVDRTPPPPPRPTVTPVDQLMARYGIDERVVLSESEAPDNDPDRIALLEFFDGMVRGDESAVRPMLSFLDQQELDALVENGDWESETAAIDRVELMTGSSPMGDEAVLARIEGNYQYQAQLWYYTGDDINGHMFEAAPTPPDVINKLSGANWIDAWHALLARELDLANMPDESLPDITRSVAVNEERGANTTGLGGGGLPGGGGGQGLRDPGSNPVTLPGQGGDDDVAGGGAGGG